MHDKDINSFVYFCVLNKSNYMADFNVVPLTDFTDSNQNRTIEVMTCRRVCSQAIRVTVDRNGIIQAVGFAGGCAGNTTGLSSLLRGMGIDEAISRLEGIDCGGKGTSCPDQLARTLRLFKQ